MLQPAGAEHCSLHSGHQSGAAVAEGRLAEAQIAAFHHYAEAEALHIVDVDVQPCPEGAAVESSVEQVQRRESMAEHAGQKVDPSLAFGQKLGAAPEEMVQQSMVIQSEPVPVIRKSQMHSCLESGSQIGQVHEL